MISKDVKNMCFFSIRELDLNLIWCLFLLIISEGLWLYIDLFLYFYDRIYELNLLP